MSKLSSLLLTGVLISANALAADTTPAPSATASATASAELEAQLAAARQKLETAARDVAQLSSQLSQSAMAGVKNLRSRAVLGLQLDTEAAGKDQGATVKGVSPGGPAAEAGIVTGDVIVALNGEATTGPNASREVVEGMANVKPDSKVTVKVLRDGKAKELQVTARAGIKDFFFAFDGPGPQWMPNPNEGGQHLQFGPNPAAGIGPIFEGMELADLSPGLGQYFGTGQGVLVIRAPREGEFLKLQDGDVIQSIDGRVPDNGSHATRILRSYQPGEKIHLKVMRQKKAVELEGTLPERRRFGPRMGPGGHGPGPGGPPGDHPPTDAGPAT